jgi:peptide deformylase
MAARRIRQLGDPILRVRCTPVEDPKSPAVRLLSDDLRDTLRVAKKKYNMGRALAAPQIGAPVRVVLVEIGKFRATMINPEITDVGSEDFHVGMIASLSQPVRVARLRASLVMHRSQGKQVTMELEGPIAELLQHELDHLDGILALDQPSGLDPFAYRAEWEKHHKPDERYGAPRPREV